MMVSVTNPHGQVSISDLEMAAHLLHYMVLEYVAPLRHRSVGIFSDNTPTVAWATKLCAASPLAGALLRALALRHHVTKSSPVATAHIAGDSNAMTDFASRAFPSKLNSSHPHLTTNNFLYHFVTRFPSQTNAWHESQPSTSLTTKVISVLRGKPSTLASWTRITKNGGSIGVTGANMCTSWGTAPTLTKQGTTASSPSPASRQESAREPLDAAVAAAFKQSQTRWAPSQRPSRWVDGQARCIGDPTNTSSQSNA